MVTYPLKGFPIWMFSKSYRQVRNLLIHQRDPSFLSVVYVQRAYDLLVILGSGYKVLVPVPITPTFLHRGWIAREQDGYSEGTVDNGVLGASPRMTQM